MEKGLFIRYFLNGEEQAHPVAPGATILNLLHEQHKLFGTKAGCREGDCGACTVALGVWRDGRFTYEAAASCIYPVVKLHGKHLITVEGLAEADALNPVQERIIDKHGVQCGFCTPGIVMSMFCLFAGDRDPSDEDLAMALDGNICRCTGYEGIRNAGRAVRTGLKDGDATVLPKYAKRVEEALKNGFPPPETTSSASMPYGPLRSAALPYSPAVYDRPETEEALFSLLGGISEDYEFIAGGTDVYVRMNAGGSKIRRFVDIGSVKGWNALEAGSESIRIGAAVSVTRFMEHPEIRKAFPVIAASEGLIASRQIRNTATVAGNIGNASPVGDLSVILLGLNASLELKSSAGTRIVPLADFFLGYKKTALTAGEVIASIILPRAKNTVGFFEKSSKRKSVDISGLSSCLAATLDADGVALCRIAFGGAGPTPVVIPDVAALHGRPDDETVGNCAEELAAGFPVISDIRGSEDYRRLMIRNHVIKHMNAVAAVSEGGAA